MTTGPRTVAIGADHRGTTVAQHLADRLKLDGHTIKLIVCNPDEQCDYPEQAYTVGKLIGTGEAEFGVLVCGTAIGMSIAANKLPGVRAAVVHDELTSQLSRTHNNANVLCLSADLLGQRLIDKIVDVWLDTGFEAGGRHDRRLRKIAAIERGEDPATVRE